MTDSDTKGSSTGEHGTASDLAYAEAMAELEDILGELEGADVDIDVLAERVQRATELIGHCRNRIERARLDVEDAVGTLEGSTLADDDHSADGAGDGAEEPDAG